MYSSLKMSSVLTDPGWVWFCVFLSKEMCCGVTSARVKKTSKNNITTENKKTGIFRGVRGGNTHTHTHKYLSWGKYDF